MPLTNQDKTNQDKTKMTRKICSACGQTINPEMPEKQYATNEEYNAYQQEFNQALREAGHAEITGGPDREQRWAERQKWIADYLAKKPRPQLPPTRPTPMPTIGGPRPTPRPTPIRPGLPVGGVRPTPTFPNVSKKLAERKYPIRPGLPVTRPNLPNIPDRSTPDVSKKLAERKYPTRQSNVGSVIQQRNWYK